MNDTERVIKGLSELHGSIETMEIIGQAITLLKEQESERLEWIGAVAKLTAENELLKKKVKEQEAEIGTLNRFVNGFSRDAIPVVRCKDCKYYDYHNGCMSWHDVNSNNNNWYCADGERRMDDA